MFVFHTHFLWLIQMIEWIIDMEKCLKNVFSFIELVDFSRYWRLGSALSNVSRVVFKTLVKSLSSTVWISHNPSDNCVSQRLGCRLIHCPVLSEAGLRQEVTWS